MNTWSFPHGAQNKNKTDPLTFTHQEINNNILDKNNQQDNPNNNNKNEDEVKQDTKMNYYKDLKYEGQKTNEMRNFSIKDIPKHGDNQINENNNNQNNLNEEGEEENNDNDNVYIRYEYGDEGQGNYSQNYDDLFYISDILPPQNFSEKLRNIKIKYQKLKEDIERLKKENKKYNPYFITRNNNNIP